MDDDTLLLTVCVANAGYLHAADALAQLARAPRGEEQLWASPLKNLPIGAAGRTRFAHAIYVGDVERVRFFLQRRVDVNALTGVKDAFFGRVLTPVELAAAAGHDDIIALLAADPRIDAMRVARAAAARGLLDLLRPLAEAGALDIRDDDDDEPHALHWAARFARLTVVPTLLSKQERDLTWFTVAGQYAFMTPLCIAASSCEPLRFKFVELLLEHAASISDAKLDEMINPEDNDDDETTPLRCAWTSKGDFKTSLAVVRRLVPLADEVNSEDDSGADGSLLWWLLENSRHDASTLQLLPRLYERGARVYVSRAVSGVVMKPYEFAIRYCPTDTVRELLRPTRYLEDEDERRDDDVTDGLFLALDLRKFDVARELLSEQASLLEQPSGRTALHAVASSGEGVAIVLNNISERRIRLESIGMPVHSLLETRFTSATPLLAACLARNWTGAIALVRAGARVNAAVVETGKTSLMLACDHKYTGPPGSRLALIKLLILKNADAAMTTITSNRTALHFAADACLPAVIPLLARCSTTVIDARDSGASTPLMLAADMLGGRSIDAANTALALLSAGASPTLVSYSGTTAAEIAMSRWTNEKHRIIQLELVCVSARLALLGHHQPLVDTLLKAQSLFGENEAASSIVGTWAKAYGRIADWIRRSESVVDKDALMTLVACGANLDGALDAVFDNILYVDDSTAKNLIYIGADPLRVVARPERMLLVAASLDDGEVISALLNSRDFYAQLRRNIDCVDSRGFTAADYALLHARELCDELGDGLCDILSDTDWSSLSDDALHALETSGATALFDAGADVRDNPGRRFKAVASRSIREFFAPARASGGPP